ncbi:hypothetical protein KL938_003337 [Ogataea parapolymorpha]|nr:hypothetical protein KL938_003337 [Ogataea parapolymorpha]
MASNSVSFVANPQTPNKYKYASNELSTVSSTSSLLSAGSPMMNQNTDLARFGSLPFRSGNSRGKTQNGDFFRTRASRASDVEDDDAYNISDVGQEGVDSQHRQSFSSGGLDSSSEWILFSPGPSETGKPAEDPYYDDVLSTSLEKISTRDANDESFVDVQDEGDDDDSLIEDLQEHINFDIPYRKEDLNSRIDNWRKQQVSILFKDLAGDQSELDDDTIELIKAWGIDDTGSGDIYQNIWLQQIPVMDRHYGDGVLKSYSKEELKVLRQILVKLSGSLRRTVKSKYVKPQFSQAPTRTTSMATITEAYTNTAKNRDPDQFMNNKSLQKYIPYFLKNLIITSDLLPQFERFDDDDASEDEGEKSNTEDGPMAPYVAARKESIISNFSEGTRIRASDGGRRRSKGLVRRNSSDNFWDTSDLKSVNSSILTYSTGSIVGF